MTTDIVFPDKNEDAFITRAKLLGIERLIFVYPSTPEKTITSKDVKMVSAILGQPGKIAAVKSKSKLVIVRSSERDLHVIEHESPSMLFDLEQSSRSDSLHQRASGLNHILARACAKSQTAVAFSFQSLLLGSGVRRAELLGRMMQNIMLCRKCKVSMKIASFAKTPEGMRNPADLKAVFTLLGMHPAEAARALA